MRELQIKPILWFLMRSFCAPVLKYKSAQRLQLETHARTCYNFYKIFFVSFIPLGTLVRYTDRKGGEAVEYSDHELVRGIKGGDKSALELWFAAGIREFTDMFSN